MKGRYCTLIALIVLSISLLLRFLLTSYPVMNNFTLVTVDFFSSFAMLLFWWCLVRAFSQYSWIKVAVIIAILLFPLQKLIYNTIMSEYLTMYLQFSTWLKLGSYILAVIKNDWRGLSIGIILILISSTLKAL